MIFKILATWLATIDTIIDAAQGAFVKGRSIADNIHLVQELLRKYNRKTSSPRCILKVDLQTAFDTVDWKFRYVFLGLGFPSRFVHWVMKCVTSTTSSVSINGCLHGYLRGARGCARKTSYSLSYLHYVLNIYVALLEVPLRVPILTFTLFAREWVLPTLLMLMIYFFSLE